MEDKEHLKKIEGPLQKALEEIIVRCKKAGIEYKWSDLGIFSMDTLVVLVQDGPRKHEINLFEAEAAQMLLNSDFEKYVFIEGYEGICSYKEGCVEAAVGSIGPTVNRALVLSRLTGKDYKEVVKRLRDGKDNRLVLHKGGAKGASISIGMPSKTLLGMRYYVFDEEDELSVRMAGLQIARNSEAAEQLARLTNSLFFELRNKRRINLFVKRRYEVEASGWAKRWSRKGKGKQAIGFPKFEYDKEPIELYWHAVSAYKMPLMQYLAYYQILEYYFVKYSMLGAKREIGNCVKDPEFNADDDDDIMKIVKCVSGKLGRFVSEVELLRDTIRECLSDEELESEASGEWVKDYFRKEYKIVPQYRVGKENREKELSEQLAERIYDIRCRIVHTKEGDKRGRIMPFTKEEVLLRRFDLRIIETIANKVLIANSRKLSS